jgi:hypothetical protein
MLCLPYYAYVFSSTKSVIGAEPDLPGTKWGKKGRVGRGAGGRNDPNNYYAHVNEQQQQKELRS